MAQMTGHRETFEPDAANADLYRRVAESVYKGVRDATDPVLERSFAIFH
jgi:hypothetical protein